MPTTFNKIMPLATGGNASGNASTKSAILRGVSRQRANSYAAGTPKTVAAKTAQSDATSDISAAFWMPALEKTSTTEDGGRLNSSAPVGQSIANAKMTSAMTNGQAATRFNKKTLPKSVV